MTENPKLDSEENSVSDHINADKPDSVVIDMETFIHGVSNKENNPNSRFPRSLSRKGSLRGDKKNVSSSNSTSIASDHRDSFVCSSSSPGGLPEKLTAVIKESGGHQSNPQTHRQITFTSRNSIKRSPPPWLLEPNRILLFFATLQVFKLL
ncbi:uncharacterized protein LOC120205914 [Hibiscus syriacus]|uniref:uncharacterized protein LOC120205914 n=1 Tax=Hibiscus syriacus TaxID=106335 RepID=UPI001921D4B1|nr:uncharacterized protein LOC120205914 [Hibiscus syriacus]